MVGVVVITHGHLAVEMLATVRFVIGGEPALQVETISMLPDSEFEEFSKEIEQAIDRVDVGDGVLLLTDMFGGTPSNVGLTFLDADKVEVISGVNLPMLLKLASVPKPVSLAEAVEIALRAGKDNIIIASGLIKKRGS